MIARRTAIALAIVLGCASPALAAASAVPSAAPSVRPSAAAPAAGAWVYSASPAPLATPFQSGGGPDLQIGSYLFQLLVVTAVVCGLGYFGLKLLARQGPKLGILAPANRQLKLVERLALDPKHSVFVVSVGKRHWLLAATETHVTPVAELAPEDLAGDFARLVEQENPRGETP